MDPEYEHASHPSPSGLPAPRLIDLLRDLNATSSRVDAAERVIKEVLDGTGARWAEIVEPSSHAGIRVLASTDEELSWALYRTRLLSEKRPPLPDAHPLGRSIVIDDLRTDHRWPNLVAASETLPLRSAVLEYLAADQYYAAGLAVYDHRPGYFSPDRQRLIALVADLSTPVLAGLAAREDSAHLRRALDSNRRIAAAVGILMHTRQLSQEDAYRELASESQHRNRRIRELAEDIIGSDLGQDCPRARSG